MRDRRCARAVVWRVDRIDGARDGALGVAAVVVTCVLHRSHRCAVQVTFDFDDNIDIDFDLVAAFYVF